MQWRTRAMLCLLAFTVPLMVRGQQSQPSSGTRPAKAPTKKAPAAEAPPEPEPSQEPQEPDPSSLDPEALLQMAVQQSRGDVARLVTNLEAYLVQFPDSPRRADIYRALAQAEMRNHDQKLALDYAERVVAIEPDDIQTMFLAVTVLETLPDGASQIHAIDYDTRLIGTVAKADPESRPQQMTLDDWQAGRNRFTTNLYLSRGRLERHLQRNDDAVRDFTQGFLLLPNAESALNLGEIAEQEKHPDEAIYQYALAFVLSGRNAGETPLDRNSLLLKMANLWRFSHDSNAGLGDALIGAFDQDKAQALADKPDAVAYNPGLTDPLQFTLRRVDGSGAVKMAETRGKVVILNFWTTWCAYCQTIDPMLAEIAKKFATSNDVVFLAINADEEEALVKPFLDTHKVDGISVSADGLDRAFHVASIPTIIVLDRSGKVAYRSQGFAPDGFVDAVSGAVTKASGVPAQ